MSPHDREESSTVKQARLVERICTAFEEAWRSGRRPRIEDFVPPDAAAGAFPKNASEMRESAARSAAEPDAITRPVSMR